ncbi:hypothetical protein PanWU01x14_156930, partial [Parasponia andersonii]
SEREYSIKLDYNFLYKRSKLDTCKNFSTDFATNGKLLVEILSYACFLSTQLNNPVFYVHLGSRCITWIDSVLCSHSKIAKFKNSQRKIVVFTTVRHHFLSCNFNPTFSGFLRTYFFCRFSHFA